MQRIRMFYEDNKIWLYILRYILIAIVLSITAILIDTKFVGVLTFIPSIFLTSIDLAKVILATLAGALLTITTFTFSTIMVVLTMYSSEFSPRVVDNFLNDKISMKVLGIFVGGFLYCISTLFFMKNSFSNYLVISASIAVAYSILSIIYFVIFVYSVSSSIQATKLIGRLYDESYTIIEKALDDRKNQIGLDNYEVGTYAKHIDIHADRNGYLELISFNSILERLKDFDSKIIIKPRIGEFIYKNQNIARLYYNYEELDENIDETILKPFSIEEGRIAFNDYQFSIQKIIDIALRALSPGINDPNTAIHCINIIGVLLSKLGEIEGKYTVIKEDGYKAVVIYEDFNFKEDIYLSFYQILHYGKEDISVIAAMFDALKGMSLSVEGKNLNTIREFKDYIYTSSKDNFHHKFDLDFLEMKKDKI
ncbi:MAG: DUF2254 domain-containing protein [Tissierellia bacterium]|nr:DUF2254 domain-containing protein [Tissierellia bacterium]